MVQVHELNKTNKIVRFRLLYLIDPGHESEEQELTHQEIQT